MLVRIRFTGLVIHALPEKTFVSELLKIYPEAAQIRDNRKNLPLHCLVMPVHAGHGYLCCVELMEKNGCIN